MTAAERMKMMRDRRRTQGLREIRLRAPDPRSAMVRARVADAVKRLSRADEEEALAWIEAVAEFDDDEAR